MSHPWTVLHNKNKKIQTTVFTSPWNKNPQSSARNICGDTPTTATSKRREVKKKKLKRNSLIQLGVYMDKNHLPSLVSRHLDCSLPATSLTVRLHSEQAELPCSWQLRSRTMGVTVTTERENGILKSAHLQRIPLKCKISGDTEITALGVLLDALIGHSSVTTGPRPSSAPVNKVTFVMLLSALPGHTSTLRNSQG